MFQEGRSHTDACILHHNLILAVLLEIKLPRFQVNAVARSAIFHSIGQQIVQNLRNFLLIPPNSGILQIDADLQALILTLRILPEDFCCGSEQFLQIKHRLIQGIFPRFQPGQLQNVVDQGQQLLSRKLYFPQIVPDLPGVLGRPGFLGKFTAAQDGIQRGSHVMGHPAEEFILCLGALFGRLQGFLEKNGMLQFLPLFRIHIPEAQDHLIRCPLGIVQSPDVHPPVAVAKQPLIIPAVVPDPLPDSLPDILQGKAHLKGVIGVGFHQLMHGLHDLRIIPMAGKAVLGIVVHLDGFIGALLEIHPENGIERVSQHVGGIVGPLDLPALEGIPDDQIRHRHKQHRGSRCHKVDGHVGISHQHGLDGNGDDDRPTVVHLIIVGAPGHTVQILKGRIISVQAAIMDESDQVIRMGLQRLLIQIPVHHCIDQKSILVAQVVGVLFGQFQNRTAAFCLLDEHIHSKYIPLIGQFLGDGHRSLTADDIGIGIAAHRLSPCLQSLLIPHRILITIVLISIPGIGGDDLPIHHRIGVYCAFPKNVNQFGKIPLNPVLHLIQISFIGLEFLDILAGQHDIFLHIVQEQFLLQRIAPGQSAAQILRILQQLGTHQQDGSPQQGSRHNQEQHADHQMVFPTRHMFKFFRHHFCSVSQASPVRPGSTPALQRRRSLPARW